MYSDIHQQVTDTILKQLEKGVAPWHKPWKEKVGFKLPVNKTTGNLYNGVNVILLWASAEERGFQTNEWASFQQWRDKKEIVRKGEKGTMIVYYDTIEKQDRNNEDKIKKIPFIKSSYVFNRAQLQSYNADKEAAPEKLPLIERIDIIDTFVHDTGVDIRPSNCGAYYVPATDKVHMPDISHFLDQPDCKAAEAYYSTLFHELTHWTGHINRLNRGLSTNFGSEPYAKEELVAELGASYLGAEFEIEKAPVENHVNYIGGWLKKLKDDKHFLISAASSASKATGFLHKITNCRNEKSLTNERE
ncbi:zincin-like metallopeptidase domain-containing protein [soil metagenome]